MKPLVSILMPTFNQAEFLPAALNAIKAQHFTNWELIVGNDASTDDTGKILWDFYDDMPARMILQRHPENSGTATAINTAFNRSSGSLITWVSSDNTMRPDWLATLVEHLQSHPEHGAVYSAYVRHEGDKATEVHPNYPAGALLQSENCYYGPSFLIRREFWQDHRGGTAHDYDNWARVEEACEAAGKSIGYVGRLLCDYRVGPWCTARKHPERYDAAKWRAAALQRRTGGVLQQTWT